MRQHCGASVVSIALTIALVTFVLLSFTMIVAGPRAGSWLAGWFGLFNAFDAAPLQGVREALDNSPSRNP